VSAQQRAVAVQQAHTGEQLSTGSYYSVLTNTAASTVERPYKTRNIGRS
jgi:hypothetical protein